MKAPPIIPARATWMKVVDNMLELSVSNLCLIPKTCDESSNIYSSSPFPSKITF
jgi:hypothetical protein